jgi:hypothetical protein
MSNIGSLSAASAVSPGDSFAIWSGDNQDTRRVPESVMREFIASAGVDVQAPLVAQYAAPSATAFGVTVNAGNAWLILTPTAGFAAGTITLPASRTAGQRVQVNCTQAVTALTVDGAGTTVTGAPTTLAANAFFTMTYDAVLNAWFRTA